ncbi:hypothetical protein SASPL_109799 [Salvia splendens]|uniref:Disease resistance protein RPM1 n=1 Tax=Salvia splendens TaxID=180675 RepID=A0A8X8YKQ7_SALSN|nr:probable disease resistance protein RF9 [Salvia splendens]KAG6431716.1 hypothetical protein SASPL_109799 [Salvia splendens]
MADAVANVFLETLRNLVVEETKFLLSAGADVQKVKGDLESIHALLMKADRERRDSPTLKSSIRQLKDLAFKAENLLETYDVEVQSKRHGQKSLKEKFQRYICIIGECCSIHEVGNEARDIISALADLTKKLESELDHQGSSSHSKQEAEQQRLLRQTYAHEVEHDFVGMKKDIQLLVSKVKDETRKRRVVKIYGMGGLGKTTLARKVYNHADLQSYARAWVCITQQFQPKAILCKILKELDSSVTKIEDLEIEDLVTKIHSLLEMKRKCLVVMDDIWEDDHWEIIRQAFPVNCDVILTTRSQDIANQQSEPHTLEFLTKDEGWTLLQKVADISPDDTDLKSLEDIGRKIVSKCEGLPLSICVLGGILRNKVHTQWIEVNLNMESLLKHGKGVGIYEKVNQELELSYDALPYYLKPCFLYLACFPEDDIIRTEELYLLWMAEGFISYQDKEANETLRDVAQRYLIELGMRCMVQLHEVDTFTPLTKFVSCGLHDLMHELCSSKAEKEQFLMRIDASKYLTDILLPTRIAISYDPSSNPSIDGLKEVRGLRSIIVLPKHYCSIPTMGFKESMVNFKMSRYLRIFVVEGCKFEGEKLPSKVGELIHLRYLSLWGSNVRELPKCICSLPYLQTLDLRVSDDIKLPNVIWKMKRLKHLFLDNGIEVIGGEKLKLGGLQELETLDKISSETACIADIPTLISLQKMGVEVRDVDVDNMSIVLNNINSQLRESHLSVDSCDFSSEKGREVLNHGMMSPSLVSLDIWSCIMSSSFPYYKPEMCQNLKELRLRDCKVKVDVKDFGKYPMLQHLWLEIVETEETLTCHSNSFPRLEQLRLRNLHDLKVWEAEEGALPKLEFLSIDGCPNLEKLPPPLFE